MNSVNRSHIMIMSIVRVRPYVRPLSGCLAMRRQRRNVAGLRGIFLKALLLLLLLRRNDSYLSLTSHFWVKTIELGGNGLGIFPEIRISRDCPYRAA